MRERWTPTTRNTKRLFMINFSLKHQRQNQHLNQKINLLDDDDKIKRGDETPLCAENNNTITFTFMIMQMLYYIAYKKKTGN